MKKLTWGPLSPLGAPFDPKTSKKDISQKSHSSQFQAFTLLQLYPEKQGGSEHQPS